MSRRKIVSGPPNVLLITTDQQRGDCIGRDRRQVRTPHLDRLCDEGTRFSTCITPNPMCQPARASILTGLLPYSHGVRDNGRNLDEALGWTGIGGTFAAAGYRSRFIGKAHFSSNETFAPTGMPECYRSTTAFPQNWAGPYFGFENVSLTLRPHHHCGWAEPPCTLHYEDFLNVDGQGAARWETAKADVGPATGNPQAWRTPLHESWQSTTWVGDQTVAMIREMGETPTLAWLSFPDPHPPFLASAPWSEMYDPAEVDIPEHRTLDLDRRPWWHKAFLDHRNKGDVKRDYAAQGKNWADTGDLGPEALRQITAIYYGMVSAVDHQLGRILDALDETGQRENSIIVFASDHGEWLGDHGLLLKGPMLYDGLLRVPLVMAGPGIPHDKVVADPVSTLDLRSTLADLAGVPATTDDGASLRPVMAGEQSREFALNEWEVDATRSGIDLDLRSVRTRRHRLTTDLITAAGELYDLQEDPYEMNNLWDDPGAAALRSELMEMINSRPTSELPPARPRVGWH